VLVLLEQGASPVPAGHRSSPFPNLFRVRAPSDPFLPDVVGVFFLLTAIAPAFFRPFSLTIATTFPPAATHPLYFALASDSAGRRDFSLSHDLPPPRDLLKEMTSPGVSLRAFLPFLQGPKPGPFSTAEAALPFLCLHLRIHHRYVTFLQ